MESCKKYKHPLRTTWVLRKMAKSQKRSDNGIIQTLAEMVKYLPTIDAERQQMQIDLRWVAR